MDKKLTIEQQINTRIDELINHYNYKKLDKNVENFLRENANKFEYFPFIGPLFDSDLALGYDKDSGDCLDIDIVYENNKIVLTLFTIIGTGENEVETEMEDISLEDALKEINNFQN